MSFANIRLLVAVRKTRWSGNIRLLVAVRKTRWSGKFTQPKKSTPDAKVLIKLCSGEVRALAYLVKNP
ncbi:MAG: hypothetical protein HY093_00035 [Candidatus Liptonbacteria bacterium]|nr:hypothetical protein [Candidatus Liptonbacteria bacterium]